jgi:hypothetical protein
MGRAHHHKASTDETTAAEHARAAARAVQDGPNQIFPSSSMQPLPGSIVMTAGRSHAHGRLLALEMGRDIACRY